MAVECLGQLTRFCSIHHWEWKAVFHNSTSMSRPHTHQQSTTPFCLACLSSYGTWTQDSRDPELLAGTMSVVLNLCAVTLWGFLFTLLHIRYLHSDSYQQQNYSYEAARILPATTTRGTVLNGCSIRTARKHCIRTALWSDISVCLV